jgi:hypothetical protein
MIIIVKLALVILNFWMAAYYCTSPLWIAFWIAAFLFDSYKLAEHLVALSAPKE